jgi:hypothetical protein
MSNLLANYSKTVIYKIECNCANITDIYIGHTTSYYQRYRLHKSNCNNKNTKGYNYKIYTIIRENGGWENWNMIILEKYPCVNVDEARERERYWIEKYSSSLNVSIPNRSKQEYSKIYRILHREEIAEKSKIYRSNNKDKIKEYIESNKEKITFQKQNWYDENKTEVLEKAKQHYLENKEEKINYQKQYAEENKEQIKSYQEEYREKNKEKLAEQKKEYRAIHKEEATEKQKMWRETNKEKLKEQRSQIINCECGFTYTFGNKHRHIQSKSHNDYQNKLCGIITETKTNISEEEKLELLHKKQKENKDNTTEKNKNLRKIYNEENKEQIKEQTHKYYEEHKEEIKQKTKLYAEENKEKVKEYKDEWYQKNKEKILTKQKESFLCDCGSKVRCSGKAEHLRSEKHKKYINNS